MTRFTVKLWLPLLAALSAGCTTMGTGIDWTASEADPINFSWERSSSVPAAMSSPLSDESHYQGQLFQITKDSTFDEARPVWSVRFPGWSAEDRWGAASTRSVVNQYAEPTVANSQCAAW